MDQGTDIPTLVYVRDMVESEARAYWERGEQRVDRDLKLEAFAASHALYDIKRLIERRIFNATSNG